MTFDIIILSLAVSFLIAFFLTFIRGVKNLIKNDDTTKIVRAALVLMAGTFIFFGSTRTGAADDIYKFVGSFYASARLFLVDGTLNFSDIRSDMALALKYSYFGFYYLTALLAVSISAYTVLSFFKSFSAGLKLQFYARRRDLCIFNELNAKSLSAAKKLLSEQQPRSEDTLHNYDFFTIRPQGSPLIVFCDVFAENNEISHEFISEAEAIGAICFKKNVVDIHKQLHKIKAYKSSDKNILRYYLFGQNEIENVRHAIDIANFEDSVKNKHKNLGIFVLAFGNANGVMISSLNKTKDENLKNSYFVRRLDPALIMAQHIVCAKENILVDKNDPDRDLNVLVVGAGQYGFEIVKTLSWYYQRKTGKINIHIVDKDTAVEGTAGALYPDFVKYKSNASATEDSQFSLIFHSGCDVFSNDFLSLLNTPELEYIDAVFTTLGDDTLNAEAALHIRMQLDRIHYKEIYKAEENPEKYNRYIKITNNGIIDSTKIFAVIHNDENDLSLNSDSSFSSGNYNVSFVGMDSSIYSCENIYNFELENKATQKHGKNFKIEEAGKVINSYNLNEQHRISSIAHATHKSLLAEIYGECDKETLKRIEKKRWNAFMRSIGFVMVDSEMTTDERTRLFKEERRSVKRRFNRGKWHNSIVAFGDVCKEEQDNNLK